MKKLLIGLVILVGLFSTPASAYYYGDMPPPVWEYRNMPIPRPRYVAPYRPPIYHLNYGYQRAYRPVYHYPVRRSYGGWGGGGGYQGFYGRWW
jgi:hypothetical protein